MRRIAGISLDAGREQAELEEYLGDAFTLDALQAYERTVTEEFKGCGDEAAFYRTSQSYLYNLTAFAMTGTKIPYLRALTRLVSPGARLLDYGCGIGSDGLLLLEAGHRVEFADFDNPSTEYLRWRLARRGLTAPIYDIDQAVPDGFDAAYAFDVIEHVDDPIRFLEQLEERAALVAVNLLRDDDVEVHHDLPIDAILQRAAERRIRYYRVFAHRSHLVAYDSRPSGLAGGLFNRLRLGLGRQADRTRYHASRVSGRMRAAQ